jgi:hypothetical protein
MSKKKSGVAGVQELQNETAAFAYLATEFCCPTRN